MSLEVKSISNFAINNYALNLSNNTTGFTLNASYVHLTSGTAIGSIIQAQDDGPLSEIYVFLSRIDLINPSTNAEFSIRCTVRNLGSYISGTNKIQPGNTLYATSSSFVYPGGASFTYNKWIKIIFNQPYNCVKNELIYIVIENNSVVPSRLSYVINYQNDSNNFSHPTFTTTSGFATSAGTTQINNLNCIIKIGDSYFGMPFTKYLILSNYPASTGIDKTFTGKIGIKVSSYSKNLIWNELLGSNLAAWARLGNNTPFNGHRISIFDDSTTPSGTTLYSKTFSLGDNPFFRTDSYYLGFSPKGQGPFKLIFDLNQTNFYSIGSYTYGHYIEDYDRYPAVFDSFFDNWNICPFVYRTTAGTWSTRNDCCPIYAISVAPIDSSNSVVANIGELELLDKMLKDSLTTDEDYILKLYNNNVTPSSSSVAADFTEATFTNYVAKTLTRSSWSSATTDSLGQAQSSYAKQSWTCGTVGDTIYGYYVVGATSGVLLWAEKFTVARVLSNLNGLEITPKITLNNQY